MQAWIIWKNYKLKVHITSEILTCPRMCLSTKWKSLWSLQFIEA